MILAVDGLPVRGTATSIPLDAPPAWQAGQTVTMTILRGGEQLAISVPVVQWTALA